MTDNNVFQLSQPESFADPLTEVVVPGLLGRSRGLAQLPCRRTFGVIKGCHQAEARAEAGRGAGEPGLGWWACWSSPGNLAM